MSIGIPVRRHGAGIVAIIGFAQAHLPQPAQAQQLVPQQQRVLAQRQPVRARVPVLQQVPVQRQLAKKYYE